MTKSAVIILLCILFFFTACTDENNQNIPNVQVNFTIYLNDPDYNALKAIGSSLTVNGGYSRLGGIILYRSDQYNFKAYDRVCTFNVDDLCQVDIDGALATCPCCESIFVLTADGSIAQGPATAPLKEYNTSYDAGSELLHVYN